MAAATSVVLKARQEVEDDTDSPDSLSKDFNTENLNAEIREEEDRSNAGRTDNSRSRTAEGINRDGREQARMHHSDDADEQVRPREEDFTMQKVEEGAAGATCDMEVLLSLHQRVEKAADSWEHYRDLLVFLLFTGLYCTVLFLQADSFNAFKVSQAHFSLLPPGLDGTGPFDFQSARDVYQWLNDSIIQKVWLDPECGNGICERPLEYPGFGPFGCSQDCGLLKEVTLVDINFVTDFDTPEQMAASDWNLCMTSPVQLCWFNPAVKFTLKEATVSLEIPDGDWQLRLNSPFGSVTGTVRSFRKLSGGVKDKGTIELSFGKCFEDLSKSRLSICRQTCEELAGCIQQICKGVEPKQSSGFFVDCALTCNQDPELILPYKDATCRKIFVEDSQIGTGWVRQFTCNLTSSSAVSPPPPQQRRLLEDSGQAPGNAGFGHVPSSIPHWQTSSRRNSLAAQALSHASHAIDSAAASPSSSTGDENATSLSKEQLADIWAMFGPVHSARIYNLQVAVLRALYVMMSNLCLSNVPLKPSLAPRLVAFLCTWLGGPTNFKACNYTSLLTGRQLISDAELTEEMRRVHSNMGLGHDQQWLFVVILEEALQTVALIDMSRLVLIDRRMQELGPYIIHSSEFTCNTPNMRLDWSVGQQYAISITQGDTVEWVWQDDEPHSLRLAGLGDTPGDPFEGMGAGRLVVSRNSGCTAFNLRNMGFNDETPPNPCVLPMPYSSTAYFAYAKQFNKVGNFSFTDGRFMDSMSGTIQVQPGSATPASTQSDPGTAPCAKGCQMSMLADGMCNIECQTQACAFDGGDCSCSVAQAGHPHCTCPPGQVRGVNGACCEEAIVGSSMAFPFEMRTFGPNVTATDKPFIPDDSFALTRIAATHVRVVVGMLLYTKRGNGGQCQYDRFVDLYPFCIHGRSSEPFGVNPVFLPTSVLYDPQANITNIPPSTLNKERLPYGFIPHPTKDISDGFALLFDINLNNQEATQWLRYLVDGFFIDNATQELDVQLVTYNGQLRKFTNVLIKLTFQQGGLIAITFNIDAISVDLYQTTQDWFRFCMEAIFVMGVFWNIYTEFRESWREKRRTGSWLAHWKSISNYLDLSSISIQLICIVLWVFFVTSQAMPFKIRARYDVYANLHSKDQYLHLREDPSGYQAAIGVFVKIQNMISLRSVYFALQGINIFLMVLRLLGLMDFQPRMGILTRTLRTAAPELVHFFILWAILFMGYCLYGHLVFGPRIDNFRTLASSMVTCFYIMLTDTSVNESLMQLTGAELVAAVIFFWSYVLFVVFVLLNIVIAIVVDAFMEVKANADSAPLMPEELFIACRNRIRHLWGPFGNDSRLLRYLRRLGAGPAKNVEAKNNERSELLSLGPPYIDKDKSEDQGFSKLGDKRKRQKIMVLDVDGEIALDTTAIMGVLERASTQAENNSGSRSKRVDPGQVAEVLIRQYGHESEARLKPKFKPAPKQSYIIKEMLRKVQEGIEELKSGTRVQAGQQDLYAELTALREEVKQLKMERAAILLNVGGGATPLSDTFQQFPRAGSSHQ